LNQINPKKLLNSKWTATHPSNKEKHFIVTKLSFDEETSMYTCELESVFSKRAESIDWKILKDSSVWISGWHS